MTFPEHLGTTDKMGASRNGQREDQGRPFSAVSLRLARRWDGRRVPEQCYDEPGAVVRAQTEQRSSKQCENASVRRFRFAGASRGASRICGRHICREL